MEHELNYDLCANTMLLIVINIYDDKHIFSEYIHIYMSLICT